MGCAMTSCRRDYPVIVIATVDEAVGGLAVRKRFSARLARPVLIRSGPEHDLRPGGHTAL
ncbi:MAG: hypothetical protein CR217_12750 [Beijerinckiaceae bacterium]|nr:MAG: hypothetical protein CR217_12750 [Beijerinckiaceae bacterium]